MSRAAAVLALVGAFAATAAAQPAARTTVDTGTADRDGLATARWYESVTVDTTTGALVVTAIEPTSPWHLLGVTAGDTIVAIQGHPAYSILDLAQRGASLPLDAVTYIEVLRKTKPLLLRRVLTGTITAAPAPAVVRTAAEVSPADLDRWIVVKGNNTWDVDVDAVLADPLRITKGARVTPATKNGKPYGFKLYAVRPGSFFDRIGMQNGDTILAANGKPTDTMAHAMDTYGALRTASEVRLSMVRRGKPLTLTYRRMK